jgi:hypothetical protein
MVVSKKKALDAAIGAPIPVRVVASVGDAVTALEKKKQVRAPSRMDKKACQLWLTKDEARMLKMLALQADMTLDRYLKTAINTHLTMEGNPALSVDADTTE